MKQMYFEMKNDMKTQTTETYKRHRQEGGCGSEKSGKFQRMVVKAGMGGVFCTQSKSPKKGHEIYKI